MGGPAQILRSAIGMLCTAIGIHVSLWLVETLGGAIFRILDRCRKRFVNWADRRRRLPFVGVLKSLAEFNSVQYNSISFLHSIVDEAAIVLWSLLTLFFLAQWQGDADAWIDAVNETSTLPVVTFVVPEKNLALGRALDNPLVNPAGFRVIGDRQRYDSLLGRELNDSSRVWRLLIDRSGYFYIFPALPSKDDNSLRPPIVVIRESDRGDQLLILSPQATEGK